MFRKLCQLLRELGVLRLFIVSLLLRAPFDFLSTVLSANLIYRFIRLMEQGNKEQLLPTFWLFLLLSLLLFVYNMTIWATISMKLNLLLLSRLRKKLFTHILSSEYADIQCFSSGEWINRMNYDVDRLHAYMMGPVTFMHLFIALVNLILSSIILAFMNLPLLVVSVVITVPLMLLSCIVVVRRIPEFKKRAQEKFGEYTNWAEPILRAHQAISIFDGKDLVLQKVEDTSLSMLKENMKAHRAMARSKFLNTLSGGSGYVLLLALGGTMMGEAIDSLATLMKITQYRAGVMQSVFVINRSVNNMKNNRAGAERTLEVFEKGRVET
ncbi:MAG: ABC transporter ATP-binding protein [Clostridiales bacterium]|nr:ABC transporter ATP-binding protein [Clostridiales bacterium]